MTLDFTARASLELMLRGASKAVQNEILTKFNFARSSSVPNGRVMLFDWTAAYLETAAQLSIANTGVCTLTNTAVTPTISFPSDSGAGAPGTAMKLLALEAFLISKPAVTGELRDAECLVTLTKTGPATVASSTLYATGADQVAHVHWSDFQLATWNTLVFSAIKQHGARICAILIGQAP